MQLKTKETIVFIHGFLSGEGYWYKQKLFFEKYYNVVTLDLKGYGNDIDSMGFDSIKGFAIDIIAKLEILGVDKFHLVGHSMGGMIAQEILSTIGNRVQKVVLYGTGANGELPGRFEPIKISIEKAYKGDMANAIKNIVSSWFYNMDKALDYIDGVKLASAVSKDTYINGLKAMEGWKNIDGLKNIQNKTLIVWGDSDRTYDYEQPKTLKDNIKNSQLVVIENSAHNIHLERPNIFNNKILEFLQK